MLLQNVLFCSIFFMANAARTTLMNRELLKPLYTNSSAFAYPNSSTLAYAGVARGVSTGYHPISLVIYIIPPTAPAGATAVETVDSTVIYSIPNRGLTTIPPSTAYNYPVSLPSPTIRTIIPATPAGATAVETTSGAIIFSMPHGGLTTIASSTAYISYRYIVSSLPSTYTQNGQVTTSTHHIVLLTPVTSTWAPGPHSVYPTGPQTGAAASVRAYAEEMAVMLGGAVGFAMAL
jgi:hypothetical protein